MPNLLSACRRHQTAAYSNNPSSWDTLTLQCSPGPIFKGNEFRKGKHEEIRRTEGIKPITDLPKDTQALDFKSDVDVFPLS